MMSSLNRYESLDIEGALLTSETRMEGGSDLLNGIFLEGLAKGKHPQTYAAVRFVGRMEERIVGKINQTFGDVYLPDKDGYAIEAGDEVCIYSDSMRGLVYGAYTLRQQSRNGFLRKGIIYNVPLCSFRGLKIYLPAGKDIDFFKTFVDLACYYRYNTIIVEVGGAMEFKRHPEINEGWTAYCEEMREYSGKATAIQTGFQWEKNSIHCENGGGNWLTQDTVKELVAYCTARGLDVIPEVPSLSHCDYLLTRHQELAERKDDPYPDTYCPSNSLSYELLFDVLDEVAEVFQPGIVHIGHDEYYSVAVCELCKEKDAAAIFAEDLNKIHEYLAGKGIRTMMWSDKLLNSAGKDGTGYGGAERILCNKEGIIEQRIPATYPAIDRIPSGMQIMHWYWFMPRECDEQLLERDLYTVYGNFEGPGFPGWGKRLARGIQGASISNWSALQENYVRRNGIFFNMVYGCRMFWQEGYDETMYPALADEVFEELFRYVNRAALAGPHIEITHATTFKHEFEWFFDGKFIDPLQDCLGEYAISFDDGTFIGYPVDFGTNISSFDCSWGLQVSKDYDVYEFDRSLIQISGTALPVRDGSQTWYKTVLVNPFPGKKLTSVEFKPNKGLDAHVVLRKILIKDGTSAEEGS